MSTMQPTVDRELLQIGTARNVEKLAQLCTTEFLPEAEVELHILKKITPTLKRRGWELTIYNEGTITVVWEFMLRGTAKRVCRKVRLVPV